MSSNDSIPDLASIDLLPQFTQKRTLPVRAAKLNQQTPLKKARNNTVKESKATPQDLLPQFSQTRTRPSRPSHHTPQSTKRARSSKATPQDDAEYQVEAIVGERTCRKKTQYRVKWLDFPDSDNTWEDAANVKNLLLLDIYLSSKKNKDDSEYEVEAIVGQRTKRNQLQYLVKWRGYPIDEQTWEPVEHLVDTKALDIYLSSKQEQEKVVANNEENEDSDSDSDSEYEVEAVVDQRTEGDQLQYLVKWRGYSIDEQTWEPAEYLTNSKALDLYLTWLTLINQDDKDNL